MKILLVFSFVQIVGASASVTSSSATPAPELIVCLDRIAQASTTVTYLAQSEASKLLARAGIQVAWTHGSACQTGSAIQVHLTVQTPDNLMPGALAFCQPSDSDNIRVLYDRVQSTVTTAHEPQLLAYVLVHEIVHILEGEGRHSSTGIMKAQWTPEDYAAIASGKLTFAPEDLALVRNGMIDRQTHPAAAAHALRSGTIR